MQFDQACWRWDDHEERPKKKAPCAPLQKDKRVEVCAEMVETTKGKEKASDCVSQIQIRDALAEIALDKMHINQRQR